MYNPNQPGNQNPPPAAHSYGATVNHQGGTGQPPLYGNVNNMYQGANGYTNPTVYDLASNSKYPYAYEDPPQNVTENGGLYDEYVLSEFSSLKIRHAFIRKVYSLLSLQLLFTFGAAFAMFMIPGFALFVKTYSLLFLIFSLVITFPVLFGLACFPHLGKKYPINMFLLFLVTLGVTAMVLLATINVKTDIFLYAVGTTFAVTLGLTLFSFQTKYDFTGWAVYLYIAFLILFVIGILGMFMPSRTFNLIYAGIGTALLSVAIIVDTQLIVGGKRKKYEYSIDDYVFATLTLYMDIVNLFLMILSLFSNASDS